MNCIGKDGPPSKHRSLYEHYAWKFDQAAQDFKRATTMEEKVRVMVRMDSLCSMALRDYLLYTGEYKVPSAATDAENVARVLREYRGVPAQEVAVWEMCSVKWVRNSRLRNGLNPEDGEERQMDERTQEIVRLRESGKSLREVAQQVGLGKSRVQQILTAAA